MHPARLIELTHGRINDGESGASLTPYFKLLPVIFPMHLIIFRPKGAFGHVGKLPEDLFVKISPNQLPDENVHFLATLGVLGTDPPGFCQHRSRGNRAKPKMGREAGGRVRQRIVSFFGIAPKIFGGKRTQGIQGCFFPSGRQGDIGRS